MAAVAGSDRLRWWSVRDAALALLLGGLLAPFAAAFDAAIAGVTWLVEHAKGAAWPWCLPLCAAGGALLSAWFVAAFAPECAGAGTDSALAAFHHHQGRLRARVPFAKLVASALVVGSGGSGGRQGPIVQIGGAVGAWLADVLRLPAERRQALLVYGIAAGIGAAFRAPLGGGLFAAEFLSRAPGLVPQFVLPACLASATGHLVGGACAGQWGPLLPALELPIHVGGMAWLGAALLGLGMAPVAWAYAAGLHAANHLSRRLPWPRQVVTALGGAVAGSVALGATWVAGARGATAVAGQGLGFLQEALAAHAGGWQEVAVLTALAAAKMLATAATIGTGGSAGLFAPALAVGAAAGGGLALASEPLGIGLTGAQGSLLGMAAVFGAAAKTPVAATVLVVELTGARGMALPCLLASAVAFAGCRGRGLFVHQPLRWPPT